MRGRAHFRHFSGALPGGGRILRKSGKDRLLQGNILPGEYVKKTDFAGRAAYRPTAATAPLISAIRLTQQS